MITPLSQLPRSLESENPLAWQFELTPNVSESALGLHADRLVRAARMAGFGKLIIQSYFGDQTRYEVSSHNFTEMYQDSSAAGTVNVVESRAETACIDVLPDEPSLFKNCQWPTAKLRLNRTEMASLVASAVQNGVPQNEAWAETLDTFLRRSMRKAA